MKQPMQIHDAMRLALHLQNLLQPYSERINIAGSLRRRWRHLRQANDTDTVGDIEIVCQPHYQKVISLFPDDPFVGEGFPCMPIQHIIKNLGTIIKGKSDGRYIQILLPQEICLDLFMPQPHDYYRQLAIRTGSADFSHKVLAVAWKKLGWVGTPDGLRREEECKKDEGASTWKCIVKSPILPPHWTSEQEFFEWLGLKYVEPYNR